MSALVSPYVGSNGLVRRCCTCGAFRNHDEPGRWDLLASPPADVQAPVSHGLCERCFLRDHAEPGASQTRVAAACAE